MYFYTCNTQKPTTDNKEYLPFWASVVIVSLDGGSALLEADVVEASERGSADVLDGMVWYQEVFLEDREGDFHHNMTVFRAGLAHN